MVTTLILSIAPDTSFAVRAEFSLALAQMVSISTKIQTLVTDEKTSNVLSLHNKDKDKDNHKNKRNRGGISSVVGSPLATHWVVSSSLAHGRSSPANNNSNNIE